MVLFVCLMTFAGSLWQYGSELRYQQTVCPERLQLIHQKNNIFILQRFLYKSMPSYCFTNNLLLNATASFAMINNFPTISVLWKNCVTEKCKVETTPKKGNIFFFFSRSKPVSFHEGHFKFLASFFTLYFYRSKNELATALSHLWKLNFCVCSISGIWAIGFILAGGKLCHQK